MTDLFVSSPIGADMLARQIDAYARLWHLGDGDVILNDDALPVRTVKKPGALLSALAKDECAEMVGSGWTRQLDLLVPLGGTTVVFRAALS
jgi:hypothetical protein